MKLQMLGLAVIGVIAAVAASLLVASIRTGSAGAETAAQAQIVVAAGDLAATTVVGESAVTTKSLAKEQAPEGSFGDPAQVVGRVLTIPVVAGEVLTTRHFAPPGSGTEIAAKLKPGMRAVSISLADYSRLDGLLYPGCIVDVLGSFSVAGQNRGRYDTMSITLLKAVQVLAVHDRVIAEEQKEGETKPASSGGRRDRQRVTLLVTPDQAQALQLAMEYGELSLSLRNPKDTSLPNDNVIRIKDLSHELRSVLAEAGMIEDRVDPFADDEKPAPAETPVAAAPAPETAPPETAGATEAEQPKVEYWTTVLIKGGVSETRQFPINSGSGEAQTGE